MSGGHESGPTMSESWLSKTIGALIERIIEGLTPAPGSAPKVKPVVGASERED